MNNGITGDNDLNLALDVTAGQMNYSAIANSSTCFIVRAPTAWDVVCLHFVCVCPSLAGAAQRVPSRMFVWSLSWHLSSVAGGGASP